MLDLVVNEMEDINSVYMPVFNEKEFCLVTFGHSITYPGHTYGPATRSYYLIHYILSGKGTFKAGQQTYKLHAGQGFLIEPNVHTVYSSDIDDPWVYVWVAFGGQQAKQVITSIGLSQDNPIFSCTTENGQKLKKYVLEMLKKNNFSISDIYYRWGLLFKFISVVADAQKSFAPKIELNAYVSHMMDFIHNHIEENITVQDVADYVNLTRSYATTIFTQKAKMSLKEYIQNCKLTKARHMLESSSMTVAEIAYSCGYLKVETFTKAFTKMFGVSPGEYRKDLLKKGPAFKGVMNYTRL